MTDHEFIYDAVRTALSMGKIYGSLHEVRPIDLGAGLEAVNIVSEKIAAGETFQ